MALPTLMTFCSFLQFAPTYHEYVLYSNTEGEEGSRKYRSRTFVPTGPEMDTARRSKHLFENQFDDIQLASFSSSSSSTPSNPASPAEASVAVDSSLLFSTSKPLPVIYDTSLVDLDLSSYPENVPSANQEPK